MLVEEVLEGEVLEDLLSVVFVDFFSVFSVLMAVDFSDFPVIIFSAGFSTAFGFSTGFSTTFSGSGVFNSSGT